MQNRVNLVINLLSRAELLRSTCRSMNCWCQHKKAQQLKNDFKKAYSLNKNQKKYVFGMKNMCKCVWLVAQLGSSRVFTTALGFSCHDRRIDDDKRESVTHDEKFRKSTNFVNVISKKAENQ